MRAIKVLSAMGLILVFGVGVGQAQVDCTTQPGNVIVNCGFDTDVTSWGLVVGDLFGHASTAGDFALGAGTADAADVGGGVYRARITSTACVSGLPTTSDYEAGASFAIVGGGTPGIQCRISVLWYINGCTVISDLDEGPWFVPTAGGWNRRGYSFGLVGGENPQLILECEADADFTALFDDAVVGLDWIPVELQSFSVE